MRELLRMALNYVWLTIRPRHEMAMEVLALRHEITVLRRQRPKPELRPWDRWLWMMLRRVWPTWRTSLMILRPETVIGWRRAGFRMFWRWKSRQRPGRSGKDSALTQLIRQIWALNPTWGSPRIRDELAKLGLQVSTATIRKYRPRSRRQPSQSWRTFLRNRARLNCPTRVKSSNCPSWADCIIVTLGKPPKVLSPDVRPKRWSGATPLSDDL